MAHWREKPRDSGRRGQGRNGRVDSAGEREKGSSRRGRVRSWVSGSEDPEAGVRGGGPPGDSGTGRGFRASPGAGPVAAAAAAAQVAQPGGGDASSPSPGPAAVERAEGVRG